MGIDKLLYFKHDVIGADLMMLACKSTEAFTAYFVLYSYCFEHALLSIPKNIALERVSDFTDNVDKTVDILVKRGLAIVSDTEIIIVGAPERVQNGMDISKKYAGYQKNYRERQKNKVKNNDESKNIEQDTNNERYKNKHPLSISWDKIHLMSDIQLKTSSAWLYNNKFPWDENTVLLAIDFLSINKDKLSNRIMCDWQQDGLFKTGYEFDLKSINEHFEKKGKKFIVNKNDCGTGTVYPEEYKTKTKDPNLLIVSNSVRKAIHKKTEEEIDKEMLEQIGGEI